MQTRNGLYSGAGWLVAAVALAAAPSTGMVATSPGDPIPASSEPAVPAMPRLSQSSQGEESSSQESPSFEFALRGENKCVAPYTHGDAKTEEGKIEVEPDAGTLTVTMTGGVGANVFLGAHSEAVQTFRLIQEFEVTCSDPSVREMILTLDSKLVGFVRSKHKASACVRLASLTVTPAGSMTPVLSVSHPLPCVGGAGCVCEAPLGSKGGDPIPAIPSQPLPMGAYVIDAHFYLTATADGFLDAHATAIFSPEPEVLDPWEREHDPFVGEEKDGYGFTSVLTASKVGGAPVASEKTWGTVKKRLAKAKAAHRLAARDRNQANGPQAVQAPTNVPRQVSR